MQNERIPKKALLRALRGIRSFAHALLFFCKQSFKTLGISILYTCQETTDNFLFTPQVVSAVRLSPVLLVLKILFQSVSCIHEFFLPLILFPFPFFQVFLLHHTCCALLSFPEILSDTVHP